jgi:hypothetical protein
MIDIFTDQKILITNWEKHQNIAGLEKIRIDTAARVLKYREKKRLEACNVTVTQCNAIEREEEKEIEEESKTKKAASAAIVKTDEKKTALFKAFRDSFHAKTDTTAWNWSIQGKSITALVKRAEKYEEPFPFAARLMETYYGLTKSNDKFWAGQPFTPMNLNSEGIFNRVIAEMGKAEESDKLMREVFGGR